MGLREKAGVGGRTLGVGRFQIFRGHQNEIYSYWCWGRPGSVLQGRVELKLSKKTDWKYMKEYLQQTASKPLSAHSCSVLLVPSAF